MKTAKQLSKEELTWPSSTTDVVSCGALQRIADATELMASKYIQMEKDLAWYKQAFADRGTRIDKYNKQISSLKGQITKLKNKQS